MQIDPWILTFSALTVLVTIWMGFWSARKSKTASDFFVAGRSVSVGWNASAISGEYLSAASFMGVAGMVMSSGYDALWYPVCYACGYLFLLLFIAGPLRRFGAYTIPDFAEGRFDSPLFRKIAVVFVLFIGFFYTMPQMKGAGTTLAYIFPGLPYWTGVVLVGAVITLNVALGGMKGITLVQAFQYWAKMFAISVPIFVLMAVYGHYGKQVGANGASADDSLTRLPPSVRFEKVVHYSSGKLDEKLRILERRYLRDPTKNYSVLGPEANSLVIALLSSNQHLDSLLFNLASFERKTVYREETIAGEQLIPFPTHQLDHDAFLRALTPQLESRGIAMVTNAGPAIWLLTTNSLATTLRQSLSAKAPRDETWLNPFGPLTTKAASSIKPRLTHPGPWQTSSVVVVDAGTGNQLPKRVANYIEAKLQDNTQVGQTGKVSATLLIGNYAYYAGRSEQLNPDGYMHYATTKGLDEMAIDWAGYPLKPNRDVAAVILQALTTNGVSVIRESGNLFRAFPTKEAIIGPVNTKPYSLLYTYSLIIALVCGTAGLPHILVRFYTNPDGVAAKRTTMWVMILIGVFYLFPPVFGVLGRNLMPDLYNGLAGVKGTDGIVLKLPKLLNERFGVLGSVLSGVTCAGAFAAFMSTFSGLLVSMTGALAHDVYGRILRPKSTPDERMKMFKLCTVIVGAGAMLLGFLVESFEINKMVGWAFAIAATSYFPLLFLSTWWRGITMKGAATGMLVGGTLSLLAIASTMFADQAKWAAGLKDYYAAHPLLRILAEQPAIWALPLAMGLMFFISKLTAKDVPADIRMKMLVLHAPEKLGLKQEYIQEHQQAH